MADSISAQAGCNTQNGGYTITDGVLEVGAMASTMMACDDALISRQHSRAPLEGTTWVVTGLVATGAISGTPMDSRASLTVTDGSAAIETGCNTGKTE